MGRTALDPETRTANRRAALQRYAEKNRDALRQAARARMQRLRAQDQEGMDEDGVSNARLKARAWSAKYRESHRAEIRAADAVRRAKLKNAAKRSAAKNAAPSKNGSKAKVAPSQDGASPRRRKMEPARDGGTAVKNSAATAPARKQVPSTRTPEMVTLPTHQRNASVTCTEESETRRSTASASRTKKMSRANSSTASASTARQTSTASASTARQTSTASSSTTRESSAARQSRKRSTAARPKPSRRPKGNEGTPLFTGSGHRLHWDPNEVLSENQKRCRMLRRSGLEDDNGEDSDADLPPGTCGCDNTMCQRAHKNESAKRKDWKRFHLQYPDC
ncbi:hypothetical protein C8F04DRAFT_1272080 [Mycena alexandri]|uniref:Uncharacterized protein n=1 Tax=Mycena alexandri TaxID=1745969 RepID=A0AAD6SC95_9AGAR|nr:hypothetical protein C8F04DRAFT_1272080 [Mycena alexandri]